MFILTPDRKLLHGCEAVRQLKDLYVQKKERFTLPRLKVVGEVKKVGKGRNFCPKVGKSRNFSVFKVGKSRNFISVFVTSLHTGTSYMLISFADFEANHQFFQNCTFYTQSVAIEEPYCVLLIANYCLRTEFRLNWAAFLTITCNVTS